MSGGGGGGGGGGNIGIPIKLLYEAEGMKITVEMKNGEIYRGLLLGAEDTMNVSLSEVLRTAQNGKISKMPNVYLRGSSIRFIALPDLLKSAPIFQKVTTQKRKMEEAAAQRQGGTKKRKVAP
jgi:small nuclear ribonucleoprotein D3